MTELLHDVGRRVASLDLDARCYAGFDEDDGALNLEWIAPNCRVGASFSPTEGSAWWFVSKEEGIETTGPDPDFDVRFVQALRRVAADQHRAFFAERLERRLQPTNWWRYAFAVLATFNAVLWLLR